MQPNKVDQNFSLSSFFSSFFAPHVLVPYLDQWAILVQGDFVVQCVFGRGSIGQAFSGQGGTFEVVGTAFGQPSAPG